MSNTESVYKIFTHKEWAQFEAKGVFEGSLVDRADGYIHMSTKSQMQETLDKHYTSGEDIVIAEINMDALDTVKWDISRGGAKFPHQYGVLTLSDVLSHSRLCADDNGRYGFDGH